MNACEICLEHRNKQKQEPIIPHNMTDTAWKKVATDIFQVVGKPYLALVNYTTNFLDITQLPNKLSSTLVVRVKYFFFKYDIPKVIISDNGPEFTEVHSKLSQNNGTFNMSPQVHTIPKVMDKSKGQSK